MGIAGFLVLLSLFTVSYYWVSIPLFILLWLGALRLNSKGHRTWSLVLRGLLLTWLVLGCSCAIQLHQLGS